MDKKSIDNFFDKMDDKELQKKWDKYSPHSEVKGIPAGSVEFILGIEGHKVSHHKKYENFPVVSSNTEEMNTDLNYQLGLMAGEHVVITQLPTLSTDMLRSSVVIDVDESLTKEWLERERIWRNAKDPEEQNRTFYDNLEWYRKNIEDRYLKEEIEVRIPPCDPLDMELFKEGFSDALWESDLSHYSYKQMIDHKGWYRTIILTRTAV
jgi:hypothetical protein